MSDFKIFDIAGSGMSAQSVRLNTVASNLANADSVSGDPSTVYRAKHPVFKAVLGDGVGDGLGVGGGADAATATVEVTGIAENPAAPQTRYDPGNPLADAQGYVYAPAVNVVEEMTDMISASRSYQNNVEVLNTARDMMLDTLKLGQ
ncbi:MAG TPA: flagellar basal body rod protein FlgC [Steroidobacteraceae bacterium]|nr:flagellar basal body rod protein FlgC [Steroidobacteraceae bacterium]